MQHSVHVVPFTEEELEEIQITMADKILNLNNNPTMISAEDASHEIETLRRVVEKCHKYHSSRNRIPTIS
jgi:hypothetical protein